MKHKSLNVCFCFFFTCLVSIQGFAMEQGRSEKDAQWEQMVMDLDNAPKNMEIDPLIKEVVIALNLLGIKTEQSCEGHLEDGARHPFVDLRLDKTEIHLIESKIRENRNLLVQEEERLSKLYPELSFENLHNTNHLDYPEIENYFRLQFEVATYYYLIEQQEQELMLPIYQLLEQFYSTHDRTYDNTIVISNKFAFRIQSLGADWQKVRSEADKAEKLVQYQDEMVRFGAFLKDYFYQSK